MSECTTRAGQPAPVTNAWRGVEGGEQVSTDSRARAREGTGRLYCATQCRVLSRNGNHGASHPQPLRIGELMRATASRVGIVVILPPDPSTARRRVSDETRIGTQCKSREASLWRTLDRVRCCQGWGHGLLAVEARPPPLAPHPPAAHSALRQSSDCKNWAHGVGETLARS